MRALCKHIGAREMREQERAGARHEFFERPLCALLEDNRCFPASFLSPFCAYWHLFGYISPLQSLCTCLMHPKRSRTDRWLLIAPTSFCARQPRLRQCEDITCAGVCKTFGYANLRNLLRSIRVSGSSLRNGWAVPENRQSLPSGQLPTPTHSFLTKGSHFFSKARDDGQHQQCRLALTWVLCSCTARRNEDNTPGCSDDCTTLLNSPRRFALLLVGLGDCCPGQQAAS